jgi:hypothetical protein
VVHSEYIIGIDHIEVSQLHQGKQKNVRGKRWRDSRVGV